MTIPAAIIFPLAELVDATLGSSSGMAVDYHRLGRVNNGVPADVLAKS